MKRLASLDLVNQQIKIHFQLNTIRMCTALMRAVEGPGFLPFQSFPAAARTTYKYYTGRLAIFDEDHVCCRFQQRDIVASLDPRPYRCNAVYPCSSVVELYRSVWKHFPSHLRERTL